MISSKEKQIGEHTYSVRQFTTTPAVSMLTQLSGIVGPSLGAMAGVAGKGLDADVSAQALHLALSSLTQKLDDATVKSVIKQLVAQTDCDGKPLAPVYEVHFSGKLNELFSVLYFALEVQFGSFFGEWGTKLKGLLQVAANPAVSPISTGLSGE